MWAERTYQFKIFLGISKLSAHHNKRPYSVLCDKFNLGATVRLRNGVSQQICIVSTDLIATYCQLLFWRGLLPNRKMRFKSWHMLTIL